MYTYVTTKPGNASFVLARKHRKLLFTQSYPDLVLSATVRHRKSNFAVCYAVAYFPLTHTCTAVCVYACVDCIYSQRYLLHFDCNSVENALSVFQCLRSSAAFENPSYPAAPFVPRRYHQYPAVDLFRSAVVLAIQLS